jgi:tryptophan synthase beta chain
MNIIKYLLSENQMPTAWYNLQADLPTPLPPILNPGTGQPISPTDLAPLFPMSLIEQEVSQQRWIEIPDEVRSIYQQWRPTPLYRARRLEQALDTPAKIYYKYEGVSPAGSHKPNTAVAQAYYNKQAGVKRLITETGAGQWGSSLAFAGALFGLEVLVYMVKVSYHQKPYRRALMEAYGASVVASPSQQTRAGRSILESNPNSTGSLGIAISEAVEIAAQDEHSKYALGSVLNHVLLHQTIIGLRYHGMAPLMSHVVALGLAQARAETQLGCVAAGLTFARSEGILPAPEANHAVKAAITSGTAKLNDEALKCKESGESKVILFNLCGHGHFDTHIPLFRSPKK